MAHAPTVLDPEHKWCAPPGATPEEEERIEAELQEQADALIEKEVKRVMSPEHGIELTREYVDDPRNTDNAWMESSVFLFKVDDAFTAAINKGKAADDAEK